MQASSVINCEPIQLSIHQALGLALSDKFAHETKKTVNPYGNGDTSNKVVEVIKDCVINNKIDLKKKFYDCVVEQ